MTNQADSLSEKVRQLVSEWGGREKIYIQEGHFMAAEICQLHIKELSKLIDGASNPKVCGTNSPPPRPVP